MLGRHLKLITWLMFAALASMFNPYGWIWIVVIALALASFDPLRGLVPFTRAKKPQQ